MNRLTVGLLSAVTLACLFSISWWFINQPMFLIGSVEIEAAPGYELRHVSTPQLRASSQRERRKQLLYDGS